MPTNTNEFCAGHESPALVPGTNHRHHQTGAKGKVQSADHPNLNNPPLGKITLLNTPCHCVGENAQTPTACSSAGTKRVPCWTKCGHDTWAAKSPKMVCKALAGCRPSLSNPTNPNRSERLDAGDCLGAKRKNAQLKRLLVPVGGRKRNRGGGAWPWFAAPCLLPAAAAAEKKQRPRNGREKKERRKNCRVCPLSTVGIFLMSVLLMVGVVQASQYGWSLPPLDNRADLKGHVDGCLAEDPIKGICTQYIKSQTEYWDEWDMEDWDVSRVESMEGCT